MSPASEATRASALHLSVVASRGTDLDGQWAADRWDAARLGIPARRGRGRRFDTITQDWLREPAKHWSRFRLATGCAFMTISSGALALSRFSHFLAGRHPRVAGGTDITRAVLEDYMAWLLGQGYSAATRALSLSMLRVFFDACHRHGWLPGLAANATIYVEELPFHHDEIARFIPEFVMAPETNAVLAETPPSRAPATWSSCSSRPGCGAGTPATSPFRRLSKTARAGPACVLWRPRSAPSSSCRCRPRQRRL